MYIREVRTRRLAGIRWPIVCPVMGRSGGQSDYLLGGVRAAGIQAGVLCQEGREGRLCRMGHDLSGVDAVATVRRFRNGLIARRAYEAVCDDWRGLWGG